MSTLLEELLTKPESRTESLNEKMLAQRAFQPWANEPVA